MNDDSGDDIIGDSFLQQLGAIATSVKNDGDSTTSDAASVQSTEKQAPKAQRRFKSRFFFVLNEEDLIERKRKRVTSKPELPSSSESIEKRLKTYKGELPEDLEPNIEKVREFFLKELGPKTLASGAGFHQAQRLLKLVADEDVDLRTIEAFERMMVQATNLKMGLFIARYLKLPKEYVADLLESVKPPKKEVFMLPGLDQVHGEHPVRGASNGKQYRNKNKIEERQEGKPKQKSGRSAFPRPITRK